MLAAKYTHKDLVYTLLGDEDTTTTTWLGEREKREQDLLNYLKSPFYRLQAHTQMHTNMKDDIHPPAADDYGSKSKLVGYCRMLMTAIAVFSFLLGFSMVETATVAAGSISGSQTGGGMQKLQEEEQQQRPQICGSNSGNSAVTDDDTNASTTTGIASGSNNNTTTTSSLYQNPEYGIQILCPEDWVYMEMANPPPFDFQVTFMSIMDAFEVGTTLESGETLEMTPSLAILTMEVPFGNADVRLLGDIITRGLASDGQQIISANPNATLSGMPAFEVVTVEPENRTRGIQVWTVQGDRAYAVAYVSHESRFDQSLPIAQDMISSFTITNERSSSLIDNNDGNITTGIVSTDNNTSSLYENAEYGMQIRYPQDWMYLEEVETRSLFDFSVSFLLPMDFQEVLRALESGATPEVPPSVSLGTGELPFGITDVQQFGDLLIRNLTSEGQQIISTNPNATLSGMPAIEAVVEEPENRTKSLYTWTVQDDRAYAVAYVSHESRFDQSLPIAQDMISSFTITNERSSSTTTSLTSNNNNLNATTTTALNTPTTSQQFQTSPESPTTTITTNGGTTDTNNNNNQAMNLEAARQQYLQVWNQTEFQIVFNTYIEPGSATGYGIYEERENNNIFRPGETIQLYAEPAAFGHQQILDDDNGDILYLMNLTADIIMSDTNGNELGSIEDASLIDIVSHNQNTEMQLIFTVRQDDPFPVGGYIITYIVYDEVKGESFQIDKRITVASENDATDLPTSNTTTQFQTPSESISITTNGGTTDTNNNQTTSLEGARQQYLQVWNQTEFHIPFSTFIEPGSATGYGIYEERENNNIFRPGETIQLYAEPAAFGHQQILDDDNGDILYLNLTADIIIADANNGNELTTIEDLAIGSIISHRQNTEEHIELTLTQHRPLPVGEYIITYIVHDEVSGESFQLDKRITITATDNDNAGTATETVQEEQQPQEVEWLPYENATYGVRMLYPSTWTQEDSTVRGDRFILFSNFFPPEEVGSHATVAIWIDNMPQSTNLEDYLNDSIDAFMQDPSVRDFQVLSSSTDDFTLAGMPAYSFEATYTDPEFGPQHMLEVGTIIDNKGYFIQYFADRSIYRTYFPVVERMVESFEVMQQQGDVE